MLFPLEYEVPAGKRFPLTGLAQVGIAGRSKVQVWTHNKDEELPEGEKYFTKAPWCDTTIVPPPDDWGPSILVQSFSNFMTIDA